MIDPDQILAAIDKLPSRSASGERSYVGASEIGDECSRKLWLKFHRYVEHEEFDPEEFDIDDPQDAKQEATKARMRRLFQRGHDEELRFEDYLHDIGATIVNGSAEQAAFQDGFFAGHTDGDMVYMSEEAVNEFKTHNQRSFNTLKRSQLEKTHLKHFAQMQTYMKYFKKPQAVYLAVCKNDDRLFCDVIPYDQEKADSYSAKAEFISMSDTPPDRISSKPTFYKCKMCNGKDVCFGFSMPRVSCRNCTSASKHRSTGAFSCDMHAGDSNFQLDPLGFCAHHSWNPHAMQDLQGWQPMEFHPKERAVEYKLPNGETLTNGFNFVRSGDIKID